MVRSRYDDIADFYPAGFDSVDDPVSRALLGADVTAQNWLDESGFDAVTCHYGLSDIDDLDGALRGVSAALRPGGRFVFSILHPCFPGGPDVSGSWSPAGSYYDENFWTADSARSTLRRQVGANHRMLSTYLNALRRHDLELDQVAEPPSPDSWAASAGPAARHPVHFAARCLRS